MIRQIQRRVLLIPNEFVDQTFLLVVIDAALHGTIVRFSRLGDLAWSSVLVDTQIDDLVWLNLLAFEFETLIGLAGRNE